MKMTMVNSGLKGLKRYMYINNLNVHPHEIVSRYRDPKFKWVNITQQFVSFETKNMQILLLNPLRPEFFIVIFTHYKPRIAVAILDL